MNKTIDRKNTYIFCNKCLKLETKEKDFILMKKCIECRKK